MNILVTGGAGYVGTVLVPRLVASGHSVRVLDNLMYGGEGLIPIISEIDFVKGDIRDEKVLHDALDDIDTVIHLAAIVGFPACRRDPGLAEAVNFEASRVLAEIAESRRLIYASTGSNYGALDGICTEQSPLNPLSVYAKTKCKAEEAMVNAGATALRFATAYGVSPRMRLDLLINDFTNKAMTEKHLVVYESHFKRSFIHVRDMARAIMFSMDRPGMAGQVYNVGDESQNYSKAHIVEAIREKTGCYVHYAEVGKDEDARNYEVSYEKIKALGYRTTTSVREGIDELLKALPLIDLSPRFANA